MLITTECKDSLFQIYKKYVVSDYFYIAKLLLHCENIWNNYIVSILKGIYNYKQATFHFDDQITTDKKEKK